MMALAGFNLPKHCTKDGSSARIRRGSKVQRFVAFATTIAIETLEFANVLFLFKVPS
jgi:hypothetical protein